MVVAPERRAEPILRVSGLHKQFPVKLGFFKRGAVSAVDGVTFDVYAGETLGIVGESGCRFRTRCSSAMDVCAQERPAMRQPTPRPITSPAFGTSRQLSVLGRQSY